MGLKCSWQGRPPNKNNWSTSKRRKFMHHYRDMARKHGEKFTQLFYEVPNARPNER